ncbi:sugar O-acetyltransferase [Bifidobacterium psychraerophilum]|jgi:galactoside O-acetyltransferase|uniref:sugar O-acetyltransferase n=1 Tax=Bifidobacterium psychraerophilum TaxID=218140 RepID=UPI0023F1CB8B|nr:sugar O-acetyltransferase [Bifidobacterium psychraerophilum]MCI1660235.1 sugar O-acetyltransferase [Bifidobacterium psychraerophilum]MCI1803888.1 sugar O-acetyltransferase [Bifidobacterium psychraerophilum]MCI2175814.1 sugar O-acetyltransferase [Bifidobacterium psychraerophilum]MCI2182458.1 sugar O-acetyltransferase [Bifidobacterium psychraerophilum]
MALSKRLRELMNSGEVYGFDDPELIKVQTEQMDLLYEFNHLRPSDTERRGAIMRRLFASVGEGVHVETPCAANWGCNTSWGDRSYANFNLTLVDDASVDIGDDVMIGPNVTIVTTGHPIRPDLRLKKTQFSVPVSIGDNVWIGSGVTILPGVTIGRNSVIGANSLVADSIPADSVAFGSPCRVQCPIGERDRNRYWKDKEFSGSFAWSD